MHNNMDNMNREPVHNANNSHNMPNVNLPPLRMNDIPVNNLPVKTNNNLNLNLNNQVKNNNSYYYDILKNYNLVLVIIIALAWNDVAKFFINRAIKFKNLSPNYYIYYALILSVLLYCVSKYVNSLNN